MAYAVLLVIGCGAALLWKRQLTGSLPKSNPIPNVAEITSLRFSVWDSASQQAVSLEIPREHWQSILQALLPATVDPRPTKWIEVGIMDITTKSGEPLWFRLGEMPRGPGAFATYSRQSGSVYYRGGNSRELKAALQAAREAARSSLESAD